MASCLFSAHDFVRSINIKLKNIEETNILIWFYSLSDDIGFCTAIFGFLLQSKGKGTLHFKARSIALMDVLGSCDSEDKADKNRCTKLIL